MIGSRRGVSRALGTVGALLIAAVSVGSASAPASASQAGLEVSYDGTSWSTQLPHAVFASLGMVVPDDSHERTVYLRNASSDAALLRVSGIDASASSDLFADALFLTATDAASAPTHEASLSAIGECAELLADRLTIPGEIVPVVVTLRFGDMQASDAQGDSASFGLLASLRDPAARDLARSDCGAGTVLPGLPPVPTGPEPAPSGSAPAPAGGGPKSVLDRLATTGFGTSPLPPLACLLIGAGMFLGLAARRRRGEQR